jgi:hypothetical protein
MDIRLARPLAVILAALFVVAPASAAVLYKSIGPGGVIQFSDTPPDGTAVVLEQRAIGGPMQVASLTPAANAMQVEDLDGAIGRANAQLDAAEHALALARRATGSGPEGLYMGAARVSSTDIERVEFCKRGVTLARQNLLDVLRQRMVASR